MKKINDNYPKIILTLDDDLDADFDGIKKINVLDWLLEKKTKLKKQNNNVIVLQNYFVFYINGQASTKNTKQI